METEQEYLKSLNKHIEKVYEPEYADEVREIFLTNWRRERQRYDAIDADNRAYALEQFQEKYDPFEAKEWNHHNFLSKAFIKALSAIAGWEIDKRTAQEKLQLVVILANERLKDDGFSDSVFSHLVAYREVLEKTGLDATFSEYEVFKFVDDGYQYHRSDNSENSPLSSPS